jgi:hypothetical protein
MNTKNLAAAIQQWGKQNCHLFSKTEVLDLIKVIEAEQAREAQAKIDKATDRRIWELEGEI